MENFIKKHTILPEKFVKDFFFITNKSYNDTNISIDFDLVAKWLSTRKDHLKEILIKNFEENFDYTEQKLTKKDGIKSNNFVEIKITPACFKELCMISQTAKAKEVRKYFLEMEKIVKKYYEMIQEQLNKELGLLKNNQKSKLKKKKGGIIYVIEAMNSLTTLYKLGKSGDILKRLNTYNSGNANDIEILFELYVDDKDAVETCVKNALKKFQYRKYKEIYEVDLQLIKEVVSKCDEFSEAFQELLEKYETNTKKQIGRMKETTNKLFIIIPNDNTNNANNKVQTNTKQQIEKKPKKKIIKK